MAKKKTNGSESRAVTKEFVVQQIDKVISFVKQQRTYIEAKIDFSRNDAKEQINSVSSGLNNKIDGLDKRVDVLEMKSGALLDNVKFIRSDIKEIKQKLNDVADKVERHDEDIALLKSAVTQT